MRFPAQLIFRALFLLLSVGACRQPDGGSVPEPGSSAVVAQVDAAPGPAIVFTCIAADAEEFSFTTRSRADSVDVWLPPRFVRPFVTLPVATSDADAVVYEGGGVSVRIAGTEAMLEVDGDQYVGCVEDRRRSIWADARLRGVTVRAVGNEPGWQIEITDGGQIHFLFDYGQREALVPTPEPVVNAAARVTVYHAVTSDYDLLVEIEVLACTDSMSGEEFSRTVTVEFEGRVFYGCGR